MEDKIKFKIQLTILQYRIVQSKKLQTGLVLIESSK